MLDKLGYINGDITQPPTTDPTWRKWRTENSVVKGWLINSMEPSLIGNFIRFPTAKEVWDVIATTFFDGTDTSQIYDLKKRVTKMRQNGGSIETYYNGIHALWREIDFRRPNPMTCAIDIQKFNSISQEDRVYTFLDGLDDRLDKVRSDVLMMNSFPSVKQAYAHVRREDSRHAVMLTDGDAALPPGGALATRGAKRSTAPLPSLSLIPAGQNTTTNSLFHLEEGRKVPSIIIEEGVLTSLLHVFTMMDSHALTVANPNIHVRRVLN